MGKIKAILANLALLLVGCGIAFGVLELAVRVLPSSFTHFRRFPIYVPDANIGFRYQSNQKALTEAGCYRVDPVSINAQGFRDTDWPQDAHGGVAILGDSMMEAEQVTDTETTSALLRKALGLPVINAGVMGFGTFGELATYETYVRPLNPSVVILFFYSGNDVTDNYCKYNRGVDGRVLKACAEPEGEGYRTEKDFFIRGGVLREFARTSCMACRYAIQMMQDMRARIQNNQVKGLAAQSFGDYQFDVYKPEMTEDIRTGWDLTEKGLVDLKRRVEENGSAFVLVTVPEFARVTTDWKKELEMQVRRDVPEDIDPWKPFHEVEAIAQRNNIRLLKLEDSFLPYRDGHSLSYPYFSLSCDGHWSPLGHYLAAHEVARYLAEQGLVGSDDATRERIRLHATAAMSKSPKDILGDKAYRAVFEGGKYEGGSRAEEQTSSL